MLYFCLNNNKKNKIIKNKGRYIMKKIAVLGYGTVGSGVVELFEGDYLERAADMLEK